MRKGTIILLNGVSSSGKTTLSIELAKQLPDYYQLSIDDFDEFIEQMEDRQQGKLIPVPTEMFYHRTLSMFAQQGANVIADTVLHDAEVLRDALKVLNEHSVLWTGVYCPPEELSRRERQRGNRRAGLSHEQLKFVHQQGEPYAVEVDTHQLPAEECVRKIIKQLHENKAGSL